MKLVSLSPFTPTETFLSQTKPHSSKIINQYSVFGKIHKLQSASEVGELKKIATRDIRTVEHHTNSNLQAFCWLLLQQIYCCDGKEDILLILKSIEDDYSLQRLQIEGRQSSLTFNLSQKQMSRCLGRLLDEIRDSQGQNKVEVALNKNPICLEAMIVTLRRILVSLRITNAGDFQAKVPTVQAYRALLNYFDLAFKNQQSLFLLYQDQLYLLQTERKDAVFGFYSSTPHLVHQSWSKNSNGNNPMKSSRDNKGQSLGHRLSCSLIRDSVISEVDADTPSFNFEEGQTSFSSSLVSQPSMKRSKELNPSGATGTPESLLKNNDLKISKMKESLGLFGANSSFDKMPRLQAQLMKGFDCSGGFDKIIDSVATANNTPNPLQEAPLSFAAKLQSPIFKQAGLNKAQSLRILEKSPKNILFQQNNLQSSKSLRSFKSYSSCLCQQNKRGMNRLCSNLFDISIRCVTEGDGVTSFLRKIKTYVISNGISQQIYHKGPLKSNISSIKTICPMRKLPNMKPIDRKAVSIVKFQESLQASQKIQTAIDYSLVNKLSQRIGYQSRGVLSMSSKKPYKVPSFLEGRKTSGRRIESNLISNAQI